MISRSFLHTRDSIEWVRLWPGASVLPPSSSNLYKNMVFMISRLGSFIYEKIFLSDKIPLTRWPRRNIKVAS